MYWNLDWRCVYLPSMRLASIPSTWEQAAWELSGQLSLKNFASYFPPHPSGWQVLKKLTICWAVVGDTFNPSNPLIPGTQRQADLC